MTTRGQKQGRLLFELNTETEKTKKCVKKEVGFWEAIWHSDDPMSGKEMKLGIGFRGPWEENSFFFSLYFFIFGKSLVDYDD